jgi:hypothetical protein
MPTLHCNTVLISCSMATSDIWDLSIRRRGYKQVICKLDSLSTATVQSLATV